MAIKLAAQAGVHARTSMQDNKVPNAILVAALCDPAAYPYPVGAVELIETHIS